MHKLLRGLVIKEAIMFMLRRDCQELPPSVDEYEGLASLDSIGIQATMKKSVITVDREADRLRDAVTPALCSAVRLLLGS